MSFRVPIGTSAVVAIDPLSTVRIAGMVSLAANSRVTLATGSVVDLAAGAKVTASLAAGASVNIGTMPAVSLAGGKIATTPAPLFTQGAELTGWQESQFSAMESARRYVAAMQLIEEAERLNGGGPSSDTGGWAQIKTDVKAGLDHKLYLWAQFPPS